MDWWLPSPALQARNLFLTTSASWTYFCPSNGLLSFSRGYKDEEKEVCINAPSHTCNWVRVMSPIYCDSTVWFCHNDVTMYNYAKIAGPKAVQVVWTSCCIHGKHTWIKCSPDSAPVCFGTMFHTGFYVLSPVTTWHYSESHCSMLAWWC